MCTVAINVLEPGAFNADSQYFIPLFNKISWLCGQHPRGDEASKCEGHGATQSQQGMTFQITLIFTSYFYHENRTFLKMWESIRFSNWLPSENLGCSHLQWQPSIRFSWQLTSPVLIDRFSLITGMKTGSGSHSVSENRPTLVWTP
jgi:hypothetical protein